MSGIVFSAGDEVMGRKIECTTATFTRLEHLDEVYEIERSISWITENGFTKVALQFPDELLVDAPAIASHIHNRLKDTLVFILGDTSYGSCCVDEVGAQHYRADCIVHYGQACLSPTSRLPVLYVFGKSDLDIDDCVQQVTEVCSDVDMRAILVYDTTYLHAIDTVFSKLIQHYSYLILSKLYIPNNFDSGAREGGLCCNTAATDHEVKECFSCGQSDQLLPESGHSSSKTFSLICKCGRIIELPAGESIDSFYFIFVGNPDSASLNNLMMTFNKCPFYTYNPMSKLCRRETLNVNKALMKRYYLIERAKDAKIVGIVAGTLGVTRYRDVIDHLKSLLKKTGKKSYTFAMGKLNPAKLANFAEIDIYVLVACPESTLLDLSEFYRPVISPFEMEIACNQARDWTGDYTTDFREILPGASMYVEQPDSCSREEADVSLISNKVRILGIGDPLAVTRTPGKNLIVKSEAMTVASMAENAGEFLASRSWKGLEQKLGETPVSKATEGQHGIAANYQHEPLSQ